MAAHATAHTRDSVLAAIAALYNSASTEAVRTQANDFLQAFQTSDAAWQLTNALLSEPGLPLQAYFLAAQTLHTKLRQDWDQLPAELYGSIRETVLGHAVRFQGAEPMLRSQIALVVAALVLQYVDWERPIPELIAGLAKDGTALILLDILCEIPEECEVSNGWDILFLLCV